MYRGIPLPAYGHIGASISNVSGTNLHIKLDTYNTAYASCENMDTLFYFEAK